MEFYDTADATELAARVRNHDLSATELVAAAIQRAEALNPSLNAIIHPLFEVALLAAEQPPTGPFAGVPFLLKDLGANVAGQPYHLGTRVLKDAGYRADADSYLGARFRDAGLIIIGRTNTPELGLTATTEPLSYGPTRNPWDLARSPGGSSGGSAAAVAARIVPAAHGNDGGGSIRIPAAACGLVGFKSSRGRVSNGPDFGEAWAGLAHEGVLTRSVRDAAALLDVISGLMPGDPYTAPAATSTFAAAATGEPPRLKVGVLRAIPGYAVDAECVTAAERTGALLSELGHEVELGGPAALDRFSDAAAWFLDLISAYAAFDVTLIEGMLGRPLSLEEFEPLTRDHVARGRRMNVPEHLYTEFSIQHYAREISSWWADGFDILVTPTLAQPSLPLGALDFDPQHAEASHAALMEFIPFTPTFNMTGQPAVSLPLHVTRDGLPCGVQLIAAYGEDALLLKVAHQLETAAPWTGRTPPILSSRAGSDALS